MKLVILGGGVAGAVSAGYAATKGIQDISLIEKENHLGGLHRDNVIDNFHFDIGAFFFWPSHNLLQVFPQIKDLMVKVEPLKCLSLTNMGNLDAYPVTIRGYIHEWGFKEFCLDAISLFISRLKSKFINIKYNSVDEEMNHFFGNFYSKTGLKNYITRLYGMSPSDIDLKFSNTRLKVLKKRLNSRKIIHNLLTFKFGELNQWKIEKLSYARPESGFSQMYDFIKKELIKRNINLHFNTNIKKILLDEKKIITNEDEVYTYDSLISSIPLGILCKLCEIPLNIQLSYRPMYSLFYKSEYEIFKDCDVLYNFTEDGLWKRITFHSSYYGSKNNKHYFVVESMPNQIHLEGSNGINLLDKDLKQTFSHTQWSDIVSKAELIDARLTPNAYPIYAKDFKSDEIENLKQYFSSKSIHLVGRQGEFDYISSSDVAKSAINTIDSLLN